MEDFVAYLLIISCILGTTTALVILTVLGVLFAFTHSWVAFIVVLILFLWGAVPRFWGN